ncbi:MAG: hypothetical protein K8R19_10020 [Methanosarcinales archaeon]|nr:hypothetical protein [Methanosarcinales archaeon]
MKYATPLLIFVILVFSTQYAGHKEALTAPSHASQIPMFTYPFIGNYGVSDQTFQSNGTSVRRCH